MGLRLGRQQDLSNTFVELRGLGARAPSDLSEGEPVRPPHLLHLQLEGVLIGVVLHNVIVHVHQDPGGRARRTLRPAY